MECPETLEVAPVCGSDGNNYQSQCQLKRIACVENIRVHVACLGECPCEGKELSQKGIIFELCIKQVLYKEDPTGYCCPVKTEDNRALLYSPLTSYLNSNHKFKGT